MIGVSALFPQIEERKRLHDLLVKGMESDAVRARRLRAVWAGGRVRAQALEANAIARLRCGCAGFERRGSAGAGPRASPVRSARGRAQGCGCDGRATSQRSPPCAPRGLRSRARHAAGAPRGAAAAAAAAADRVERAPLRRGCRG